MTQASSRLSLVESTTTVKRTSCLTSINNLLQSLLTTKASDSHKMTIINFTSPTNLMESYRCQQELCLCHNSHAEHQLDCPHAWSQRAIQCWFVGTNIGGARDLHVIGSSNDVGWVNPGYRHCELFARAPHMA